MKQAGKTIDQRNLSSRLTQTDSAYIFQSRQGGTSKLAIASSSAKFCLRYENRKGELNKLSFFVRGTC
jgi:hypothetical protein